MGDTGIRFGRKVVLVVIPICLLIAFWFLLLFLPAPRVQRNLVGVIDIEGPILSPKDSDKYAKVVNFAAANESIKAVVIQINCPGGYVDLIEQVYLDILELKKAKPVVASIVFAASGGYYLAVAADYIYAEPTSFLGNIGVIGVAPPVLVPSEIVLETGVYKATGFSSLLYPYNLSRALDNFVSAVEVGRGGRLKLTSSQLRKGLLYLGSEALGVGLVDELGSAQGAIRRVTQKVGLTEYNVVDLCQMTYAFGLSKYSSQASMVEWQNLTLSALNRIHPPPSIWYLYLPPETYRQSGTWAESSGMSTMPPVLSATDGCMVLVDRSHGNRISPWELNILIAELAKQNVKVGFASSAEELASALRNASSLIIACPTMSYSAAEGSKIEKFVNDGGTLLLFYDPAFEYSQIPELFGPINSLSTKFGLTFAKGYLYDDQEHFGFYRNIYVRSFAESFVTHNVTSVVFFTATHIYSLDKGVAWTASSTYSSVAERGGNYAVMALTEGNGKVIALGDMTFLTEPYCYVEDNYKLVLNLVSAILEAKSTAR